MLSLLISIAGAGTILLAVFIWTVTRHSPRDLTREKYERQYGGTDEI